MLEYFKGDGLSNFYFFKKKRKNNSHYLVIFSKKEMTYYNVPINAVKRGI